MEAIEPGRRARPSARPGLHADPRRRGRRPLARRSAEAGGRPPRPAVAPGPDRASCASWRACCAPGSPLDHALAVLINFSEKEPIKKLMGRVLERVRGGSSLADAMAAQGEVFDRFVHRHGAGRRGRRRARQRARQDRRVHGEVAPVEAEPEVGADLSGRCCSSRRASRSPSSSPSSSRASRRSSTRPGFKLPLATQDRHDDRRHRRRLVVAADRARAARRPGRRPRQRRDPAQRRPWDRRLLRLPLVGSLMARVETTRMTYTLGMLLNNGVPLVSALPRRQGHARQRRDGARVRADRKAGARGQDVRRAARRSARCSRRSPPT